MNNVYFAIYPFSLFKMASCPFEEKEIDNCIKEVHRFISTKILPLIYFSSLHLMDMLVSAVWYDCGQVMKAVDKNGDGEISKEEFVTHAFESDVIRNIL